VVKVGVMVGMLARPSTEVPPTTKPVEVSGTYEVDITEISKKGDGIARVQGFIIFVENGKVQNKIKVRVTEVTDRFAKASIVV
jgi:predicted RNA-binding protein with TRAM domain